MFCFCNHTGDSCATCEEIVAGEQALRIPFEQIGRIHMVNELLNYDLPATGAAGIYPLMTVSAVFILISFIFGFIRRRKQERRGVG